MKRVAIGIEYDGTKYYGFQKQKNFATIQEKLELAISKIANHKIDLICAGRTDRGVHALFQVAHFDTNSDRKIDNWLFGINSNLEKDIRVLWVKKMPLDFHARFSAILREYIYVIYNNKIRPALFRNNLSWFASKKLDVDKMQKAALFWIGEHDFSAFRDAECQSKTAIKTVKKIELTTNNDFIIFKISANSFLHHMVRNMVGTLIEVGDFSKNKSINFAKEVLISKDRKKAGATASASGLYLSNVVYPNEFSVPENKKSNFFQRFFLMM